MPTPLKIKKNADFQRIMASGKKLSSPFFTIFTEKSDIIKYGIVISKKVSKLAVKRNLIKRQIKSFLKDYNIRVTCNCVIIVKATYLMSDYDCNKKNLSEILSKVV